MRCWLLPSETGVAGSRGSLPRSAGLAAVRGGSGPFGDGEPQAWAAFLAEPRAPENCVCLGASPAGSLGGPQQHASKAPPNFFLPSAPQSSREVLCKGGREASGPLPFLGPDGACAGLAQAPGTFSFWGPRKPPALGLVPLSGAGALRLCGPAFLWDSNPILRHLPQGDRTRTHFPLCPPLLAHLWLSVSCRGSTGLPPRPLLPPPWPADPWVSGVPASSQPEQGVHRHLPALRPSLALSLRGYWKGAGAHLAAGPCGSHLAGVQESYKGRGLSISHLRGRSVTVGGALSHIFGKAPSPPPPG